MPSFMYENNFGVVVELLEDLDNWKSKVCEPRCFLKQLPVTHIYGDSIIEFLYIFGLV